MGNALRERIFYTAAAAALESNYRELEKLKTTCGDWESAWEALPRAKKGDSIPEALWKKTEAAGIALIMKNDPAYPPLLKEIPWPPFGIYVRGALPSASAPTLAIVGTRKATDAGKELARDFARALSEAGCAIVSGLALGVDAAAHAGCLAAGGHTLAVLGCGLDRLYPRTNEALAKEIIAKGGAIISEYPIGAPPLPFRFLERNRIVSGVSRGALIIEAPKESGSLATARFALEQNRDVFVVPGPARHPNFFGSHQLVRAGAELVTDPSEIIAAFDLPGAPASSSELPFRTAEEAAVLAAMEHSSGNVSIDKLIELTHLEAHIVSSALSFLLIKNRVGESEGGYYLQ